MILKWLKNNWRIYFLFDFPRWSWYKAGQSLYFDIFLTLLSSTLNRWKNMLKIEISIKTYLSNIIFPKWSWYWAAHFSYFAIFQGPCFDTSSGWTKWPSLCARRFWTGSTHARMSFRATRRLPVSRCPWQPRICREKRAPDEKWILILH